MGSRERLHIPAASVHADGAFYEHGAQGLLFLNLTAAGIVYRI